MYFEQALTRINNIDRDKVGTNSSRENGDLGAMFLSSWILFKISPIGRS